MSRSILIASTPVHGHVAPLLVVARHLVERGDRVRFLTGANYRDAVERAGAAWLPLPAEADYDDSDVDAAFPGRVGLTGAAGLRHDAREIFLAPAAAQFRALESALAEPTDAILVESAFLGVLPLLARTGPRPPVLTLGILPLGLDSADTAPFGLGLPPLPGPLGVLRNLALRAFAQRVVFAPVQARAREVVRAEAGADLDYFFMNVAAHTDALVQFTVAGFEYPRRDLPPGVRFVGPLSRSTPTTAPLPAWWGDLDGRPVVHVTQGTVANRDLGALVLPTIEALADRDVLVVVATGGRERSALPTDLPTNVRVADWLPYDELLPRCAAMVTNGGYGGVQYALRYGVPVVVAGATEEKAEIAARVAWSGVGVALRTDAPTPAQLRDAVGRVLEQPSYRAAAGRISAEIARSPGLAGLDAVLDRLIAP